MTNAASRRTLMAIFDLNAGDREHRADKRALAALPLPSLDERVEIYLRAVHGRGHATTAGERAAVRERILDAMADEIAREILGQKNVEARETAPRYASAPVATRVAEICGDVFRSFLRLTLDAAEPFTIRGARLTAIPLVGVLLVGGAILTTTLIYLGPRNGFFDRILQIASQSDGGSSGTTRSVSDVPSTAQIDEAAQRAQEQAGGRSVFDAQFTEPDPVRTTQNRYQELFAARNYSAALIEAQKLEATVRAQFGVNGTSYADALGSMANVYLVQGRYGEAEALYKRMLAIRETSLGAGHPDIIQTLNALAEVYRAQGRTAEAEELTKGASTTGR